MEFIKDHWQSALEILIIWVGLYHLYKATRTTHGSKILIGAIMILAGVASLAYLLNLKVIAWIVVNSAFVVAFALVIIFQPELRVALARLGSRGMFFWNQEHKMEFAEELTDTVMKLSRKNIGALITVEREDKLKEYMETGVMINADFSPELTLTIFYPSTALHDGGMVISNKKIAAAGCVFPVSQKTFSDRTLGLRHRAAVGVTEETDALAIVVSEETGAVSIAVHGNLERNLKQQAFKERLEELFVSEEKKDNENNTNNKLDSKTDIADSSDNHLVLD